MAALPGYESGASLQRLIVPQLPKLSPALRRAADYVLNNPDTIAMESLRQVAKENDLTPATFSRLARSLKLKSYEEMRDLCRDEVRFRSRSFADKAKTLQASTGRGKGSFLRDHAAASIDNIDTLLASVDSQHLSGIADRLAKARRVALVGALSSAALLDYVGYCARIALPNWQSVLRNSGSMAMDMVDLTKDDILLAVSQTPYARVTVDAVRTAHERGLFVVAVTDGYDAPIAPFASEILVAPTSSAHFFASEVATVLLLEALLSMVVRRTGKAAQRRVAAVEQEIHRSGEYWQS